MSCFVMASFISSSLGFRKTILPFPTPRVLHASSFFFLKFIFYSPAKVFYYSFSKIYLRGHYVVEFSFLSPFGLPKTFSFGQYFPQCLSYCPLFLEDPFH